MTDNNPQNNASQVDIDSIVLKLAEGLEKKASTPQQLQKNNENKPADNNDDLASQKLLTGFLKGEFTMQDIAGLDDQQMETIYFIAYNQYQTGKINESARLFQLLCLMNQLEPKYWLGLGASLQILKRYQEAIQAYATCSMLNLENPKPQLHAAECFIALNDHENALSSLETLVDQTPPTDANKPFITKAQAMLKIIDANSKK